MKPKKTLLNMLSIALDPAEHRKFTNAWYGFRKYTKVYDDLTPDDIWKYAQGVYKNYPALLEAARKTIFR